MSSYFHQNQWRCGSRSKGNWCIWWCGFADWKANSSHSKSSQTSPEETSVSTGNSHPGSGFSPLSNNFYVALNRTKLCFANQILKMTFTTWMYDTFIGFRYLIVELKLGIFCRISWVKAHLALGKVCFLYKCMGMNMLLSCLRITKKLPVLWVTAFVFWGVFYTQFYTYCNCQGLPVIQGKSLTKGLSDIR